MEINNINQDQVAQQCMNVINSKIKNLKKINIIVVGKSGVGKSTLINSVFRGNFAETGVGKKVTDRIKKIEKEGYPLAIYDTPGFELSGSQQNIVQNEIINLIKKGIKARDINQEIHCIWYCINVGGNRIDDEEIKWIKKLTDNNQIPGVPVIVVLTQGCPKTKAKELQKAVEKENLDIKKVIPVLAQDMNMDDEYVCHAYGLDVLIEVMSEILQPGLQNTLQHLQKVSLEKKKKVAHAAVATAVATAFGAGFAPIPFSDAAVLIPIQITMVAEITVIFGLDVSKSFLAGFVSSTLGSAGTTVLGRTIVSNLLKILPGIGTAAGGTISGTTAGLLTTTLGETYIAIMEMIYKGEMKLEDLYSDKGKSYMKKIFKKELKSREKE